LDLPNSELDLPKSEADIPKSKLDLPKSELDVSKPEADLPRRVLCVRASRPPAGLPSFADEKNCGVFRKY
jgi:hypothetical protein